MMDSRSGPAVETTKSPAKPERRSSTRAALSFLAVSPVMITAPVRVSLGVKPARLNSPSTRRATASASIMVLVFRGVECTSPL